ncbi:unnamed protein product [Calicophoron daubneyi]|uniref:Uncharacterized protein n=1 Tax=Calicophoron daubneyi TaxID=300641 RepID=A0AAV2T3P7_CALDB
MICMRILSFCLLAGTLCYSNANGVRHTLINATSAYLKIHGHGVEVENYIDPRRSALKHLRKFAAAKKILSHWHNLSTKAMRPQVQAVWRDRYIDAPQLEVNAIRRALISALAKHLSDKGFKHYVINEMNAIEEFISQPYVFILNRLVEILRDSRLPLVWTKIDKSQKFQKVLRKILGGYRFDLL